MDLTLKLLVQVQCLLCILTNPRGAVWLIHHWALDILKLLEGLRLLYINRRGNVGLGEKLLRRKVHCRLLLHKWCTHPWKNHLRLNKMIAELVLWSWKFPMLTPAAYRLLSRIFFFLFNLAVKFLVLFANVDLIDPLSIYSLKVVCLVLNVCIRVQFFVFLCFLLLHWFVTWLLCFLVKSWVLWVHFIKWLEIS